MQGRVEGSPRCKRSHLRAAARGIDDNDFGGSPPLAPKIDLLLLALLLPFLNASLTFMPPPLRMLGGSSSSGGGGGGSSG